MACLAIEKLRSRHRLLVCFLPLLVFVLLVVSVVVDVVWTAQHQTRSGLMRDVLLDADSHNN